MQPSFGRERCLGNYDWSVVDHRVVDLDRMELVSIPSQAEGEVEAEAAAE